jgi:hypothetical protein
MAQTRAADDFATIRAGMEELRQECERMRRAEKSLASKPVPARVNWMGQVSIAVRQLRDPAG